MDQAFVDDWLRALSSSERYRLCDLSRMESEINQGKQIERGSGSSGPVPNDKLTRYLLAVSKTNGK